MDDDVCHVGCFWRSCHQLASGPPSLAHRFCVNHSELEHLVRVQKSNHTDTSICFGGQYRTYCVVSVNCFIPSRARISFQSTSFTTCPPHHSPQSHNQEQPCREWRRAIPVKKKQIAKLNGMLSSVPCVENHPKNVVRGVWSQNIVPKSAKCITGNTVNIARSVPSPPRPTWLVLKMKHIFNASQRTPKMPVKLVNLDSLWMKSECYGT